MVCKIRSGKSVKGALNYNEKKVNEGVAECIAAENFITGPEQLKFYDKLRRFEQLTGKNARAKTNCVHISLNFDVNEKLSRAKLDGIIAEYMDKIGFGDQPYLVYEHKDAAHPHLHIVTTNIRDDGGRIPIHNLGKNESEKARKEIEEKYGLVKAGLSSKRKLEEKLAKAVYGQSETKKTIDKIVGEVMTRYKYSSLHEFNAALRQYNVTCDPGKEGTEMFKKNGLLYSIINFEGKKVGVPIKASALTCKPTMKNLEKEFRRGTLEKQSEKGRLTNIVDSFFQETKAYARDEFIKYMNHQGVNPIFRENTEGRVYGLTFVDNKSGIVFKGSDLGKRYSGQALIKQMQNAANERIKSHNQSDQLNRSPKLGEKQFLIKEKIVFQNNEIQCLLSCNAIHDEPINASLQPRKRRRRGLKR